ncbi:Formin-H [Acipenser ruthenus]|uniref:Formin-H n=1 Tax=Acipenser ruthenus TaxID=7906 RepID=A0A444V0R6_ACIRT|nr:Formin-H [Acipenser ruthenus]
MIDFNSKVICSIEKGTVKKQFPFTQIKSCEDREGTRFSISFHDRQDYELEANSQEDKRKIMQLVNKVIYNNIYVLPTQVSSAVNEEPPKSGIIREGRLDLERGELASVKWVKYLVQLHEGELILQHTDHTTGIEDSDPSSTVIHISDGNASVEKQHGCDAFTVHTKKNEYQFRVPVSCQFKSTEEIKKERDEWVLAIDKFCLHWKRKSQFKPEDDGLYSVIQESRVMDIKDQVAEKEPVSPVSGNTPPPLQTSPSEPNAANAVFPQTPSSTQLPPSKLAQTVFQAPSPKSPATVPPPPECVTTPSIPAPPPPPPPPPPSLSLQSKSISTRTKAFHWDLLSQDKLSSNADIFLRSFDVKPYELKEKLHIINAKDGGLTDEQISSLRRYVPTPDDIEMYKSYKGSPSELHVVDQYMMEMCNIPNLDNRLDLLLTIRELPISVDDLQPLINQMIKMCTQLRNSKSFVSVLKYLLVVGNYLNENAGKEKAKGFRLSSLTKLTQMRGKERKVTLLHALVQQIVLHEPDLAIFFQELTEFEDVPGASVKGLTAEVDVLKNELRKIIQHKKVLNKVLNKVNRETQFYKDLKTVLQKYEADLSQLTKKCDEMKKLYSDILVKFGEPQEQDSQELFGWVCSFISNFKRIYEEIIA